MDRKELNAALIKKSILTDDKIKILEKESMQLKTTVPWEDFLIDKKAIKEDDLLNIKSEISGVPTVDLTSLQIAQDVLNLVPEPIAHRHQVISFAKTKEDLSLAMTDPDDIQTKEFIAKKDRPKDQSLLNW